MHPVKITNSDYSESQFNVLKVNIYFLACLIWSVFEATNIRGKNVIIDFVDSAFYRLGLHHLCHCILCIGAARAPSIAVGVKGKVALSSRTYLFGIVYDSINALAQTVESAQVLIVFTIGLLLSQGDQLHVGFRSLILNNTTLLPVALLEILLVSISGVAQVQGAGVAHKHARLVIYSHSISSNVAIVHQTFLVERVIFINSFKIFRYHFSLACADAHCF